MLLTLYLDIVFKLTFELPKLGLKWAYKVKIINSYLNRPVLARLVGFGWHMDWVRLLGQSACQSLTRQPLIGHVCLVLGSISSLGLHHSLTLSKLESEEFSSVLVRVFSKRKTLLILSMENRGNLSRIFLWVDSFSLSSLHSRYI
jgi:hypothetical protein